MSRIGQKIIEIPDNVEANIAQDEIKLVGPKGELTAPIFNGANIEIADNKITVNKNPDNPDFSKNWGLQRTLISNGVIGVSEGFSKKLEINGVGGTVLCLSTIGMKRMQCSIKIGRASCRERV